MKQYSILVQNTVSKQYFTTSFTDKEDSDIYFHTQDFTFPEDYPIGEYRYYILNYTEKEITADNNHIYVDGKEVDPIATGLMVFGDYKPMHNEYNKKEQYIEYE